MAQQNLSTDCRYRSHLKFSDVANQCKKPMCILNNAEIKELFMNSDSEDIDVDYMMSSRDNDSDEDILPEKELLF